MRPFDSSMRSPHSAGDCQELNLSLAPRLTSQSPCECVPVFPECQSGQMCSAALSLGGLRPPLVSSFATGAATSSEGEISRKTPA